MRELRKLEQLPACLKRGENVQNCQIQSWLKGMSTSQSLFNGIGKSYLEKSLKINKVSQNLIRINRKRRV